jgi:flavorubredoxin
MLTFEHDSGTLFSCDMYGCFGTIGDHLFDDEMTESEFELYEREGVRYFSNVMMTFSPMVKRAIAKTEELSPRIIAPGHGPIYRSNPTRVIERDRRYVAYADGFGKNAVTILWGSMYGTTERVVKHIETLLKDAGIQVFSVHLPYDTQSEVVASTFQSAGVIVAASTYEYRMFPPVAHAIDELGRKKVTGKQAFYFGSYGWNPGAERDLLGIIDHYKMKWQFVDPVAFLGEATSDDMARIEAGVRTLIENMQDHILR